MVDLESGGVGDPRSRFNRCEEARVQRAANPGGVEGAEVKTGYSWKEFE